LAGGDQTLVLEKEAKARLTKIPVNDMLREFELLPKFLIAALLLTVQLPATVQAQFNFVTNNGSITITKYTDYTDIFAVVAIIPSVTNGYPVTAIGEEAFAGTGGFLTNVTIPSSITNIGNYAFAGCSNLTGIVIPASVTSIGFCAFADCFGLPAITVQAGNPAYSTTNGVLFDRNLISLIQCPGGFEGNYAIPDSVTNIVDYAFNGCTSLTSITIPNGVTSLGTNAFGYCINLTNITIPNNVAIIGEDALINCWSLPNIVIPAGVTSIGFCALLGCTNLTSIIIPASVTSLGEGALACSAPFPDDTNLTTVYFEGNAPSVNLPLWGENYPTVYYLPGTTGWASTFGGAPTALWLLPNPLIPNNTPSFGLHSNGFSFIISWATNIPVVVQACMNLANPVWFPVATNTLTGGTSYFSDPQWTNYHSRFYRLYSPP
jgi:hypothetical protein